VRSDWVFAQTASLLTGSLWEHGAGASHKLPANASAKTSGYSRSYELRYYLRQNRAEVTGHESSYVCRAFRIFP
jgi:hypothetical protein